MSSAKWRQFCFVSASICWRFQVIKFTIQLNHTKSEWTNKPSWRNQYKMDIIIIIQFPFQLTSSVFNQRIEHKPPVSPLNLRSGVIYEHCTNEISYYLEHAFLWPSQECRLYSGCYPMNSLKYNCSEMVTALLQLPISTLIPQSLGTVQCGHTPFIVFTVLSKFREKLPNSKRIMLGLKSYIEIDLNFLK